MYLPERELVPCARSSFSHSMTDKPRPAASRAMPAPLMPPPMTRRSTGSRFTIGSASVHRWLAGQIPPDLFRCQAGRIRDGLDRRAGDMRRKRHILELEQRPVGWYRLDGKGFKHRTPDPPVGQRLVERVIIDKWTARRVDQH